MRKALYLATIPLALFTGAASAAFTVADRVVADEKAVFATVESLEVVPALVRTGGTIASLAVREGDHVERDQVLALVADPKLLLQQAALDAQITGLQAQLAQAKLELGRAEALLRSGAVSRSNYDALVTGANVASATLTARIADRRVVEQQLTEGAVLAPTAGRVLKVPVTPGSVVLTGEAVATIAQQDFVLRLEVPERHARGLKAGDTVRLDPEDQKSAASGSITLVYPQIQNGRVTADAKVAGLGDYFVGQRIRVWISGGDRHAVIVPANLITTRFGLDYARIGAVEVPVQRGLARPLPDMPNGLEILSGLKAGDVLVQP